MVLEKFTLRPSHALLSAQQCARVRLLSNIFFSARCVLFAGILVYTQLLLPTHSIRIHTQKKTQKKK